MAELALALDQPVDGLSGLRAVLEACHALQDGSVQWDLDCWELEEGFRRALRFHCSPRYTLTLGGALERRMRVDTDW